MRFVSMSTSSSFAILSFLLIFASSPTHSEGIIDGFFDWMHSIVKIDPCVCHDDFAPVCGTDGITYGNECMLKCARQEMGSWLKVQKMGSCSKLYASNDNLICICPEENKLVCGTNGVTYKSRCALDCNCKRLFYSRIEFKHEGSCRKKRRNNNFKPKSSLENKDKDGFNCLNTDPPGTEPVCASNGFTFISPSVFYCAQQIHPELTISSRGMCTDWTRTEEMDSISKIAKISNNGDICESKKNNEGRKKDTIHGSLLTNIMIE